MELVLGCTQTKILLLQENWRTWSIYKRLLQHKELDAGCSFSGYIISPSAISLEGGATVNGGMYSPSGACSLGDGAILTMIKQK